MQPHRHDDTNNNEAEKRSPLNIIDTSQSLTTEELQALKQLAAMSKATKYVVALIFGCVALFGFDRVIGWIGHLGK